MSNPKVVVVEDEVSIREMYVMKLESCGLTVRTAENGIRGLEVIKGFRPDIVLLDLRMPQMDGQEMLRKLRDTDWGNSLPVIILTNLSQSEASIDLRFLKVDKYIVKAHTTPQQVAQEVLDVLSRHNKLAER